MNIQLLSPDKILHQLVCGAELFTQKVDYNLVEAVLELREPFKELMKRKEKH